jgi:hypothetical protein
MGNILQTAIKKLTGKMGIGNDDINVELIDHLEGKTMSALGIPDKLLGYETNPKNTKIRGKSPTLRQKKILIKNGLSNDEVELYLIQKTSFVQEGDKRRLNQFINKVEKWTLIHRETGELKEVYIA